MSKIEFKNPWAEGNAVYDDWFESPYKVTEKETGNEISNKEIEDLNWINEYETGVSAVGANPISLQTELRNMRLGYKHNVKVHLKRFIYATDIKIGNNYYNSIAIRIKQDYKENSFYKLYKFTRIKRRGYFILHDGQIEIVLRNENDRKNIEAFLYNQENNIYGNYSESTTLNDVTYSFSKIINKLENYRVSFLRKKTILNRTDDLILDLPIIEWKLGWRYAASLMFKWISGDNNNIKLTNNNVEELLNKSDIFTSNLETGKKNIRKNSGIYEDDDERVEFNNLKERISALNVGESFDINNGPNYEISVNIDNYFTKRIIPDSDLLNFSDYVGAIGATTIFFYFEGIAKKTEENIGEVEISGIYYRINDGFDFYDAPQAWYNLKLDSQPVGFWFQDVFNVLTPKLLRVPDYEGYRYLNNKDFRDFNERTNLGVKRGASTNKDNYGFKTYSPYLSTNEMPFTKIKYYLNKDNLYELEES